MKAKNRKQRVKTTEEKIVYATALLMRMFSAYIKTERLSDDIDNGTGS